MAEYVFQPNGKNVLLCYPEGLQWKRTADIYLILAAKNLGRWVHHFIVEKITQETKDEHLHVVIYDFDSPDIDLEQAFQRSTLKKYHFITKPGKNSRTVSLREAFTSIKDPNAIVVIIDLHLDLGSQFMTGVRKVRMGERVRLRDAVCSTAVCFRDVPALYREPSYRQTSGIQPEPAKH